MESYVHRLSIRFSFWNIILMIILTAPLLIYSDWTHQLIIIGSDEVVLPFLSEEISAIIIFTLLGIVFSIIWYSIGKFLGPRLGILFAKRIVAGINATPILEKSIKSQELTWQAFIARWLNFFVACFGLDFLLYTITPLKSSPQPPFASIVIALSILSLWIPGIWILDEIGLRAVNEKTLIIQRVSTFFQRISIWIIQLGSLIGILVSVSIQSVSIDSFPETMRTIFVRTYYVSILIAFIFGIFFQTQPDPKVWMKKGVSIGRIDIKMLKR